MNLTKQFLFLIALCFFIQPVIGQMKVSPAVRGELETAEAKMFQDFVHNRDDYFKKFVADDYLTINANGVMMNKEQAYADSATAKMMAQATIKLSDKQIRAYGNVGVITGKARGYIQDMYVVEFFYTAIFVKQGDKWMFTNWQGTLSKDTPPPPPPMPAPPAPMPKN